jgi:hypothetical protein
MDTLKERGHIGGGTGTESRAPNASICSRTGSCSDVRNHSRWQRGGWCYPTSTQDYHAVTTPVADPPHAVE